DELQRWNIDAGRKHIHGDDHLRLRTIAKFTDALERTINVWIASYFLNKIVALLEHIAADSHELVSVRRVRQIVDGEDEDLREVTRFFLVPVCMLCNLLDNLAIALRSRDLALHSRSRSETRLNSSHVS